MSCFNHYANSSKTAIGDWIVRKTTIRELAFITSFIPNRECSILEIGPGRGIMASILLQLGYTNYQAVEPNDTMRASLVGKGFVVKNYAIPCINERDDFYDVIILSNVFEHLDNASQAQVFIDEAWRVLKKGGVLCISSPDFIHWGHDFFNCDFSHNNITSVRRTQQLLYNRGFQLRMRKYLSAFFVGVPATITSHFVRLALYFVGGEKINGRLYKIKLTFLRRFLVIGQK